MLTVRDLRKAFDTVVAVDGVSLDVRRGELFGLLGPNGAGKTTTIRTILNIIAPDAGTITFDGHPFSADTWNRVGYLPEERGLYRKSKVLNAVLYLASLKGLHREDARKEAMRWLERFGLADRARGKVEELSKGNQQKVQLISALIHRPELVILDEPFAGFDPVNQLLLKDILLGLRQENAAIIFSTHQMEQVEKMCDSICLINRGKPVLSGPLRDVKSRYGRNTVQVEFEGDGSFLKSVASVRRMDVYQNFAELELAEKTDVRHLLATLNDRLEVRRFEIVEPSLHAIFLQVVGATVEEAGSGAEAESPPPKRRRQMSTREKKELFGLALSALLALVFSFVNVSSDEPQWIVPLLFVGAAAFSLFKYLRAREHAESDHRLRNLGGQP